VIAARLQGPGEFCGVESGGLDEADDFVFLEGGKSEAFWVSRPSVHLRSVVSGSVLGACLHGII